MNGIQWQEIVDEKDYASLMNGFDWKIILMAIRKNPAIMNARIREPHLDTAYRGGGGISCVFLNVESGEAVVAFRGTASNEWIDDFLGANQIDTLQQINAMEWYKSVYYRLGLEKYEVTVVGHSKGATKAKYIAILNDTPKRCFAFDGQGFSDEFVEHYRKQIQKRQGIIENHNIDFDYINILLNDIGRSTYYIGYDYGRHGFAESHSPNTFFDFGENGEYTMRVNPNGKRPEMQMMDQFFNSMVRSGFSQKEKRTGWWGSWWRRLSRSGRNIPPRNTSISSATWSGIRSTATTRRTCWLSASCISGRSRNSCRRSGISCTVSRRTTRYR